MAAIVTFTILSYAGIRRSSRVNLAIVAVSLGALVVFLIAGLFSFTADNLRPFAPAGWTGTMESAALLFFAYTGYARITTLAEEVREPERVIPKAIMLTIGGAVILYAAVALAEAEDMLSVNIGAVTAEALELMGHAIVIGVGATVLMDLWAAFLRRCFRIPSLDFALLGRWIGHMAHGRFRHESIAQAAPIRHERVLGWSAHYTIGVVFAALLLGTAGIQWVRQPTLLPALVVSLTTLVAPFFVMQPAMGAGIASSRTPRPNVARLRSLVTHTVYGIGLYATASAWAALAQ